MSFRNQMDDDLDGMMDLEVFAEQATVGGTVISVIFDDEYGEALGVSGTSPAIWCKSSDVAAVAVGAAVTVGGGSYTVAGIEPDGTGVTVLRLQRS
jgi:hypothetical protein